MDLNIHGGKIVKVTGNREYGQPNEGSLCVKGRFGMDFVHSHDRLKTPLIRKDGELKEATWDEAYSFIAKKLASIKKKHGLTALRGFLLQGLPMRKTIYSRNL